MESYPADNVRKSYQSRIAQKKHGISTGNTGAFGITWQGSYG